MKYSIDFIDEIARRYPNDDGSPASDYRIAKLLGITRASVSRFRTGKGSFCDETAIRAAELLGIEPLKVIAAANAERSKDEKTRGFWMRYAAATVLFTVGLTGSPIPSEASANQQLTPAYSPSICIMSNLRRKQKTRNWTHFWSLLFGLPAHSFA